MPGSNRGVIIALTIGLGALWCVFVGAYGYALLQHKQQSEQSYYPRGADSADHSTPGYFAAYRDLSKNACYSAKDHDTADLCAQWRAAIAAEKAADAARDAVNWTIVGVFLSSFGLLALLVTIHQGREGLEVARSIGQAQTRAYVSITALKGNHVAKGLVFQTIVHNSGQSPALSAQLMLEIVAGDGSIVQVLPEHEHDIGANSTFEMANCYYKSLEAKNWDGIAITVTVLYSDVFGTLAKVKEMFAGGPRDWGGSEYTELVPGRNIGSFLRAMGES